MARSAPGELRHHRLHFHPCSITARGAGQMRRVLKRGGELLFCEHGRAPDASVLAWQRRPRRPGGNRWPAVVTWTATCRPCCARPAFYRRAGTGLLPGPRPMTYVYRGVGALNPGGAQSALGKGANSASISASSSFQLAVAFAEQADRRGRPFCCRCWSSLPPCRGRSAGRRTPACPGRCGRRGQLAWFSTAGFHQGS